MEKKSSTKIKEEKKTTATYNGAGRTNLTRRIT